MERHDLKKLKRATRLLKCIAHPLRLSLLCHLYGATELGAGELVGREKAHASQSQISQYLGQLRRLKLARTRREGKTIFYRLASPEVAALIKTLQGLYCGKT